MNECMYVLEDSIQPRVTVRVTKFESYWKRSFDSHFYDYHIDCTILSLCLN